MGLLSSALRTELKRATPSAALGLVIGDNEYRFAKEGLNVSGVGVFDGRVERWGSFPRTLSDANNSLQQYNVDVVLRDEDLEVTAIAGELYRKEAVVSIYSPNLAAASASVIFTGVVAGWTPGPGTWTLHLRQDDKWLEGRFPKRTITSWRWPLSQPRERGLFEQIVYGLHDSDGLDDVKGMVLCPRVEFVGGAVTETNLVSVGIVKSVIRVYRNGTLATGGGVHYNVGTVRQRGVDYTVIGWVSMTGSLEDVVTADVEGLTDEGDGSGTLITNPAEQLQHCLVNFVHGNWANGDWLDPADAPVKTSYFTAAASFFEALDYQGSRVFGRDNDLSGLDMVNEWCKDLEMACFWTVDGKLAVLQWDHRLQGDGVYPLVADANAPALDLDTDPLAPPLLLPFNDEQYVPRLAMRFCYSDSAGKFLGSTSVEDERSNIASQNSLDVRWPLAADPETMIGFAWDVGGRRINRWKRQVVHGISVRLPLWFADAELTQDIPVAWRRGWNPSGALGWGLANYQRRLFRLTGISIDGDALEVTATLENCYDSQTSFLATLRTRHGATAAEGFMFVLTGIAGFTFDRNSVKEVADAVDGKIVLIGTDQVAYEARGLCIEGERTNTVHDSSTPPVTSWTEFGSGVNGSAIGNTVADNIWDASLGADGTLLTAGTPHAADLGRYSAWSTANYAANTLVTLSIDHKDDSGAPLIVDIQRDIDNWWWNQTQQDWEAVQPGSPDNALTVRTSYYRDQWQAIDVGAGATKLQVRYYQASGGTSARKNRAPHVQIEAGVFASSRIITTGGAATRNADTIYWTNDDTPSGKYRVPPKRGTLYCQVIPFWSHGVLAAHVPSTKKWIWHVVYDANNEMGCYYDPNIGYFVFRIKAAGNTYTKAATTPLNLVADQEVWIACRYGSDGDLGIGGANANIFVDDGKGTNGDDVAALPTIAAGADLYLGQADGGVDHWDGIIRYFHFKPFCETDDQVRSTMQD